MYCQAEAHYPTKFNLVSTKTLLCRAVVSNRGAIYSAQGCRGLTRFFTISLKIHFQAVIKPQSKLLWVRHYGCRKLLFFSVGCRKPEKVGKHCAITIFNNHGKKCNCDCNLVWCWCRIWIGLSDSDMTSLKCFRSDYQISISAQHCLAQIIGLGNFSMQAQSWSKKIESDPVLTCKIFENH